MSEVQKIQLGENVVASENNGILHLEIDLDTPGVLSKSGQSMVKGTTRGNKTLNTSFGTITIGLNAYSPVEMPVQV